MVVQSFCEPPIPATSPTDKIEAPKGAELGAAVRISEKWQFIETNIAS